MSVALVASKYRVPRPRPNDIARPRLVERLSAASRAPLTVVSAPAGFGKTTLVTEWLGTLPDGATSIGWVSLDHRDNDPALFWTYVVTAIGAAADGVGESASALLNSATPSTEAALNELINDIGSMPGDLVLVLDDYHLIEAAAVDEGMTFLLEHHPPQLHLVLATRADPRLPLARLRARGELFEIRAADLRFTHDESVAYLTDAMELRLDDSDVAALDRRTEGWIAALQLAALSMQGRDDASTFIAGFAGDDRYIVDYLVEEVLARQRPEIRDFLLNTSILERLTGPLCDAVTERSGGKSTLVALDRANLFLVALDDKREWYRYHHLFADVLQAHLADERGETIHALHKRASSWFAANGDTSQAVGHALSAGDFGRAAELIELAIPAMRRDRREAELVRWARVLPDDVVQIRPVLALGLVGAIAQVADFDAVEQRLAVVEDSVRAADGSWPDGPPPGLIVVDAAEYPSVPARIELYRAAVALSRGDLNGTVAHAREALSRTPADDDLTRAAAGAIAGLASWTSGDLATAHAAYTQSIDGLRRTGMIADVLGCCIALGDISRTQGKLRAAVRTYEWALELANPEPDSEPLRGTSDMHVALAEIAVERDDLAAAAEHLAQSERLGEHNGLPQNPYRHRVVAARLQQAYGDFAGALALLNEADRVYDGDYSPNVRPVPAIRARLLIRHGALDDAVAWADEQGLSAGDGVSYLREYEHITLVRLLLARSSQRRDDSLLTAAEELLGRLLSAAEDGGRDGTVIELLVLQSLARHHAGDTSSAVATLERAVTLAQPEGYVRLFADEGAPMAALLKSAMKTTAGSYVRRLLAATTRTDEPVPASATLVAPLSERELDVLRWLASDLDGPDIARQLSVSLNTVRTHTKNIYAKLGVTNRRAAVRQAHELKLLPRR